MANSLMPEDITEQFDYEDIEQNKIICAVAAIPLLFWLPLVVHPDSRFGRHYANQGLICTVSTIVICIVQQLLDIVIGLIPFVGGVVNKIIGIICFALIIAGVLILFVGALQGSAKVLPLVGNVAHVLDK